MPAPPGHPVKSRAQAMRDLVVSTVTQGTPRTLSSLNPPPGDVLRMPTSSEQQLMDTAFLNMERPQTPLEQQVRALTNPLEMIYKVPMAAIEGTANLFTNPEYRNQVVGELTGSEPFDPFGELLKMGEHWLNQWANPTKYAQEEPGFMVLDVLGLGSVLSHMGPSAMRGASRVLGEERGGSVPFDKDRWAGMDPTMTPDEYRAFLEGEMIPDEQLAREAATTPPVQGGTPIGIRWHNYGAEDAPFSPLSNFDPTPITYQGRTYRGGESLYQALKTLDDAERAQVAQVGGNVAQSMGRKVTMQPGWDAMKAAVMREVQMQKFQQLEELRNLLLSTEGRPLRHTVNDPFWGGEGNQFGKILEEVRSYYQGSEPYTTIPGTHYAPPGVTRSPGTIERVISGGQQGVDEVGLQVAREYGVPTGGTAPPKFFQSDPTGKTNRYISNMDLRDVYGLTEGEWTPRRSYRTGQTYNDAWVHRTIENVKNSDGTIWFGDETSPGGVLTMDNAFKQRKALLVNPKSAAEIEAWAQEHGVKTVNIAGNRLTKNPAASDAARKALDEYFGGGTAKAAEIPEPAAPAGETLSSAWVQENAPFDSMTAVAAAKSKKIMPGEDKVVIRVNSDGTFSTIDGRHKLKANEEVPVRWVDEDLNPIEGPGTPAAAPAAAAAPTAAAPATGATEVLNRRTMSAADRAAFEAGDPNFVDIGRGQYGKIPETPGEKGWLGNPTKVGRDVKTNEQAVEAYRTYFNERIANDPAFKAAVEDLRGKKLVCWDKPKACHGDVIEEYLNTGQVAPATETLPKGPSSEAASYWAKRVPRAKNVHPRGEPAEIDATPLGEEPLLQYGERVEAMRQYSKKPQGARLDEIAANQDETGLHMQQTERMFGEHDEMLKQMTPEERAAYDAAKQDIPELKKMAGEEMSTQRGVHALTGDKKALFDKTSLTDREIGNYPDPIMIMGREGPRPAARQPIPRSLLEEHPELFTDVERATGKISSEKWLKLRNTSEHHHHFKYRVDDVGRGGTQVTYFDKTSFGGNERAKPYWKERINYDNPETNPEVLAPPTQGGGRRGPGSPSGELQMRLYMARKNLVEALKESGDVKFRDVALEGDPKQLMRQPSDGSRYVEDVPDEYLRQLDYIPDEGAGGGDLTQTSVTGKTLEELQNTDFPESWREPLLHERQPLDPYNVKGHSAESLTERHYGHRRVSPTGEEYYAEQDPLWQSTFERFHTSKPKGEAHPWWEQLTPEEYPKDEFAGRYGWWDNPYEGVLPHGDAVFQAQTDRVQYLLDDARASIETNRGIWANGTGAYPGISAEELAEWQQTFDEAVRQYWSAVGAPKKVREAAQMAASNDMFDLYDEFRYYMDNWNEADKGINTLNDSLRVSMEEYHGKTPHYRESYEAGPVPGGAGMGGGPSELYRPELWPEGRGPIYQEASKRGLPMRYYRHRGSPKTWASSNRPQQRPPAGHAFPTEEGKYVKPVKPSLPSVLENIIETLMNNAVSNDPALYAELERYFRNLPR